jgi:coproporphyrinogen III oxidase-like Fe-S oxidoreductase
MRQTERLMLGLRLDRPLAFDGIDELLDDREVERLAGLGLVVRDGGALALTERGRFLGGGVTARLLA